MNGGDLTQAEVQEFVSKVRKLPGCTDIQQDEAEKAAFLFLRARKRDVNRAVELYKANKRMRYYENLDTIDPLEEGVRKELLSGKFTVLQPNTGDGEVTGLKQLRTLTDEIDQLTGGTEAPATVAVFTAHRHWPPLTTHRDTLKGVLYQLDVAMTDEQSQRKGLIVLYDMRRAKYANFDYYLCVKLLHLFNGVYPARLREVIIVDAPIWFRAPFGVLRLFVKEKMRDRISIVDFDDLCSLGRASLVRALTEHLTRSRHLDWLRTCLHKTGHSPHIPPDYFTNPIVPPTGRTSLHHDRNTLAGADTLPRRINTLSSTASMRLSRSSTRSTGSPIASLVEPTLFNVDGTRRSIAMDALSHSSSLSYRTSSVVGSRYQTLHFPTQQRQSPHTSILTSMYHSSSSSGGSNHSNNHAGRQTDFSTFHTGSLRSSNHTHDPSLGAGAYRSFRVGSKSRLRSEALGNNNCRYTPSGPPPPLATGMSTTTSYRPAGLNQTDSLSPTRLSVPEFIDRVHGLGPLGLCTEFEVMFKDQPSQGSYARFMQTENRRRNRYLDVPCLDASAVELSDGSYLHANWVDGYRNPRAYILAQGPLENTRRDFWMAVWEHRVPVVVMLTKIVEGQRIKCAPYWPCRSSIASLGSTSSSNSLFSSLKVNSNTTSTDGISAHRNSPDDLMHMTAHFGEFQVKHISDSMEAGGLYRRTRLEVRCSHPANDRRAAKRFQTENGLQSKTPTMDADDAGQPLEVDHLLYLGWPDFDVPTDPDGFLTFLDQVNRLHRARCLQMDSKQCNGTLDPQIPVPSPLQNSPSLQPSQSPNHHPLLIHCSAGIGRTGTFVTVDICLQQALNEGHIDVPQVVTQLRCQRAGAVQMAKQYAFAHSSIASFLIKHHQHQKEHHHHHQSSSTTPLRSSSAVDKKDASGKES